MGKVTTIPTVVPTHVPDSSSSSVSYSSSEGTYVPDTIVPGSSSEETRIPDTYIPEDSSSSSYDDTHVPDSKIPEDCINYHVTYSCKKTAGKENDEKCKNSDCSGRGRRSVLACIPRGTPADQLATKAKEMAKQFIPKNYCSNNGSLSSDGCCDVDESSAVVTDDLGRVIE